MIYVNLIYANIERRSGLDHDGRWGWAFEVAVEVEKTLDPKTVTIHCFRGGDDLNLSCEWIQGDLPLEPTGRPGSRPNHEIWQLSRNDLIYYFERDRGVCATFAIKCTHQGQDIWDNNGRRDYLVGMETGHIVEPQFHSFGRVSPIALGNLDLYLYYRWIDRSACIFLKNRTYQKRVEFIWAPAPAGSGNWTADSEYESATYRHSYSLGRSGEELWSLDPSLHYGRVNEINFFAACRYDWGYCVWDVCTPSDRIARHWHELEYPPILATEGIEPVASGSMLPYCNKPDFKGATSAEHWYERGSTIAIEPVAEHVKK
jgi:hypothetical protein